MRRAMSCNSCLEPRALVLGTRSRTPRRCVSSAIGELLGRRLRPARRGRRATGTTCWSNNLDFLAFDIKDFNGATFGAEWLVGLGNNFEAGLGVGFYHANRADGLHRFRRTPTAPRSSRTSSCASCRSPRRSASCRSATATASSRTSAPASASSTGATARAGSSSRPTTRSSATPSSAAAPRPVRSSSAASASRSARGASAAKCGISRPKADLPADQDFAGTKIDLGGFTYTFTVNVRF